MKIDHCASTSAALQITWSDGSHATFPYIWLRDNDPIGFHPDTEERLFDLTSVEMDIQPTDVQSEETQVSLQWPEESQRSTFEADWLYERRLGTAHADAAAVDTTLWTNEFAGDIPRISAKCLSDADLSGALCLLKRYGLAIITDLDDDEKAGEQFGDRIGFKRETNFGVMFEVINKPDPNNLAYTSVALPLHTDLANQALPPGYQFLHCVANDADGGESTFADGFAICEDLRLQNPEHFKLLSEVTIPFRFHDRTCDIRRRQTIINVDESGHILSFIFNAHLVGTPDLAPELMVAYYAAYRDLMQRIRRPEYKIELKLQRGEMVIFDNRRVMHGRNAFDPSSGFRHLRGYYIDRGEVDSRIRVINR